MAWLTDWAKRIKIMIDHNDIDASLSHFPVLLYLSSSSGITGVDVTPIFDEVGANSKKIAVTKSDGTTQLYVEIEKWDSVNEKAWLWVSRSGWSISNTVDTDIYIYYDNSKADNTTYVGDDPDDVPTNSVWDTNFEMVQHMRDYDISHIHDSTSNNNDGTKSAANHPPVTVSGKINDAQNFEAGDSDYIDVGTPSIGTHDLTVEAWFRIESDTADRQHIINDYDSTPVTGWAFHINGMKLDVTVWRINLHWRTRRSQVLSTTTWYHGTGIFYKDGTLPDLYLDGALNNTSSDSRGTVSDIYESAFNTFIGRQSNPAERYFDGIIDEVRISTTNRAASWIKATYETGRDHFVTYGSEEEIPVVIPTVTTQAADGIGFD